MKIAKLKCWLTESGQIVKDGDPAAHELLAIPGQIVSDKRLAGAKDVGDFFYDRPAKAAAAAAPAARIAPEKLAERKDRVVKPPLTRGAGARPPGTGPAENKPAN